ncbi:MULTISPECIES: DNA translocase FtsK [Rhizobium]|uniref:DNA translocase FtsK n=1 Tax=Rhizobium TaxID=379 RepID=UPI0007EA7FDE|nr:MULTISPECIES: DNA translocase FtsK [Rhizobium]ANK89707.1 cell division DNA translocase FtsK/SpoIIIE family protein [Rhizobium sp. N6212]ANK95734.1 cell division DNA translocase FtsK/SpoIIIE family protein [Rhizobium sp. N621]ANL01762.1 cell division DNA translocase FtsK/SpoIIIE family protein [Rhizobium esperanzae]ANL07890.1 cell division DNA translocase FtsK/SpoIIIE family protein [Rhizobium sp. N1341]ANL19936.1 cell division DNA translocase FtsK/SpoIIIE family protein [Rhizobium sp. N113]
MRFPRTNLTDAADFSSGIETELPEENPGERPPAPIWQSNFSLAPNVRFTRTPETLISRRRPSNEPVRCESEAEQQAIRIEPVAVDVPFDIYLPEPAEPAVAQAEIEALQPPAAAVEAPTLRVASELSSISDFAFWEVMAFEEAEPVRAPSIILPKIETAPESITSLFRIMEWRPGALKPAQTASRPVQPPALAPAPVAPRPPAAISLERPVRTREAAIAPAPQVAPQTAPMPQVTPVPQPALVPQPAAVPRPTPPVAAVLPSPRLAARPERVDASGYEFPPRALLQEPPERLGEIMSQETLEQNAGLLESVLEDFGIKGEIIHVRPGPVVTLYEFEPAPGVKSSRVIGLADDIARSMSALSARVAVVPGRNVIGIELPNVARETVYFREMIESQDFDKSGYKLALGLGKTIGGEPVIAELAKMPHLLVAGTTGSGKSVAINTMILSLLYRMTPEQCRLIMVDPKMLELSVYDGIPHLLTPVVTDPKKAVMALKWAVREMEERYRKMSRLGVRNIDGYNGRVSQAREKGETIHIMVQVGFDRQTGAPIEESQELDLAPMPYIVVIVDEMADLMMVAGKEIEGAIQRLAQMARAAGIHLIMATQRPSVDVITGTIKANFPTRISFQVTSKIDSRTILGEQGAEQLLGQGDMLHMQGGGRIARVHGPFVSDAEVEKVVAHLKTQGRPEYLDTVTADEEEEPEEEDAGAVFDKSAMASEDGNELYEQAVKVVMRDKKCSTSYIQRRLGIGYNRAASLVERMEKEGLVGPANHVGKREIVSGRSDGD